MRRIIMFQGAVETQEFFSLELAKTFEKAGFAVYWYNCMLQGESARLLKEYYDLHKEDMFYAFTMNFNGIAGEDGLYGDNGNFWDERKIPVLNMVVDHPFYYEKYRDTIPEMYLQISIDENHDKYIRRFCPEIVHKEEILMGKAESSSVGQFIPLGGTELNEAGRIMRDKAYLKMQERPMDVIFTGNYTPPSILEQHLSGMAQEYRDFYQAILEEVKHHPDALVEEVAEKHLKAEMGDLTDAQLRSCMPNMMYVDLSVRFYYRGLAVAALADAGIPVHTFGAGWDLLKCRHPENIIQGGSVDSRKCLEKISQAKISLNVMPWFKAGAHDRIFNSMLNGAAVFTDSSSYLLKEFQDNENIAFYSLQMLKNSPQLVAEQVKDLLAHPTQLQDMADKAYNHCLHRHSWKERAEEIIQLINKIEERALPV